MFTLSPKSTETIINFPEEISYTLLQHTKDTELSIEQRSEELQEAFIDIINYLLKSANINQNEKLIITLHENGCLSITDHSQKSTILKLLEQTPQCHRIMQRLAADALLKKGLQNIKKSHSMLNNKGQSESSVFQMCLKGELSHFYLI